MPSSRRRDIIGCALVVQTMVLRPPARPHHHSPSGHPSHAGIKARFRADHRTGPPAVLSSPARAHTRLPSSAVLPSRNTNACPQFWFFHHHPGGLNPGRGASDSASIAIGARQGRVSGAGPQAEQQLQQHPPTRPEAVAQTKTCRVAPEPAPAAMPDTHVDPSSRPSAGPQPVTPRAETRSTNPGRQLALIEEIRSSCPDWGLHHLREIKQRHR